MDLELAGKRALVTGASKGIGYGVARALAAEGCDVIIAARTESVLQSAAAAIAEEFEVSVTPVACDLSDSDDQARLVEQALTAPLDIVVNNAGAIPGGSLGDIDESTWRAAWDLKVFGYINLTRMLLPHLVEAGSGVILNIIGAAADRPSPGYIAGAAGNSALAGFTKAMGSRSLREGVRVLAVNPGLIVTDRMTDLLRQRAGEQFDDAERWAELMPTDPAPGTVEQVADVVAFLVSARASHVTGTLLTIDGGATAR
jgi:NAD(P)-dependent dehydrogenase (short-subunit alcohol dehydrogenase family)